jgi:hypothetical protein
MVARLGSWNYMEKKKLDIWAIKLTHMSPS